MELRKHELTVLGRDLADDSDLLNASAGEIIEARSMRGTWRVVVEIQNRWDKEVSTFRGLVRW